MRGLTLLCSSMILFIRSEEDSSKPYWHIKGSNTFNHGNVISVRGLDANDNTKVLDIKPYIPDFDIRENAKLPQWMDDLMKGYF
ncbi:Uncharacterised protein family UPF0066 [Bacillus sp. cl95]|nr:Uncharacterised protein family UPF0066 [Bacillus sp. UNCCL13]SFQ91025.1 Uncharacterised protein family UPF0066 [Bacillus sp. cl95]